MVNIKEKALLEIFNYNFTRHDKEKLRHYFKKRHVDSSGVLVKVTDVYVIVNILKLLVIHITQSRSYRSNSLNIKKIRVMMLSKLISETA